MTTNNWYPLTQNPKTLNDTIVKMHHAVQAVAAFGNSLLPKAGDDSQSNMSWHSDLKAMVGHEVPLQAPLRLALSYDPFELYFLNAADLPIASFAMEGQTLVTALAFIRMQVEAMGGVGGKLEYPQHYELPKSDYQKGAPFLMPDSSAHFELAKHRHNAQHVLEVFASRYEHASSVAIWPHHFDTGSLIAFAFDAEGGLTKSIGIGMAIPDSICDEMYYYVSPWWKGVTLNFDTLSALPGRGEWKSGQYNGALLPLSSVTAKTSAQEQSELVTAFLEQAIETSKVLIDV
ncbi:MAG: hypothetical protein MI974_29850 [Chitinophagales bacterium]|nr:hypothetical protein [Chitinophagales bacterium]